FHFYISVFILILVRFCTYYFYLLTYLFIYLFKENSLPHWGKHYPKCNGCKQSPINIDTQKVIKNQELGSVDLINFSLPHTMKMLKNNGHTVECELKAGHKYTVLQFHFHWGGEDLVNHPGSEHSLNGHRSPLEMHIVSQRSDLNDSTAAKVQDGFAVMGFFIVSRIYRVHLLEGSITISNDNLFRKYSTILEPFSMHQLLKGVDLSKYYRYNGSLTTPPCDEAVVWTIFKDPIRISKDLYLFLFFLLQFLNGIVQCFPTGLF
uniref:Si:ch211-173d10.4 n=1 Tax=Sinocyclocheilus anshuiensis TaxID=1608454 RepID=A0A671KJ48_9TELE